LKPIRSVIDYGVDTMTAGCCIGFAMECYENNIITKEDLDGIDLKWGDTKAIIALLKKIVNREGFGKHPGRRNQNRSTKDRQRI